MQKFTPTFPLITEIQLPHIQDTDVSARLLAGLLQSGDVVALWGSLGVGKSTLARALIQSLCGADTDVPSPTFTLVQSYTAPDFEIWHMDLYRLCAPEDAFELGIEDAFYDCVSLIEWPDKLGGYLPLNRLDAVLTLDSDTDRRALTLYGDTDWASRLKEFMK